MLRRAGVVCLLLLASPLSAVEIVRVQSDRLVFDPAKGEVWKVRFHLNTEATVALHLYDEREHEVRVIQGKVRLTSGDHTFTWDGRDKHHRFVAPEAYHYTLNAQGKKGEKVVHDLTDITGHNDLPVRKAKWLPDKQSIQYLLPKPARVKLRIGLQDKGPYIGTLIDWAARPAGLNSEHWNGKDASGLMDLTRHPKLDVVVMAYTMSDNTVIVGPPINRPRLPTTAAQSVVRPATRDFKTKLFAPYQQTFDSRGDFTALLTLPGPHAANKKGLPVVSGVTPVRFDVEDARRAEVLSRRIEAVLFVDGIFAFESETGFLPMTMSWDARHLNPGVHYLTLNLRGYQGNFGVATLRVYVQPESANQLTKDAKK